MSIPKFFQSTDAGAPILTASAGSLNALLKACLINGYGSKPSAGWELVFENLTNHQLAVRSQNIESDQCCYFFNDSNAAYATIAGFEEFANGVGITPFNTAVRHVLKRSVAVVNGNLSWIMIANDKSCWLIISTDANTKQSTFFGDYHAFNHLKKSSLILGSLDTSFTGASVAFGTIQKSTNFGLMPNRSKGLLGSGPLTEEFGFGNRASQVSMVEGDYRIFQPVKIFEQDSNNVLRLVGVVPGFLMCEISERPVIFFNSISDVNGMNGQTIIEVSIAFAGTHFYNISEW